LNIEAVLPDGGHTFEKVAKSDRPALLYQLPETHRIDFRIILPMKRMRATDSLGS